MPRIVCVCVCDFNRYRCHELDLAVKHVLKSLAERISPFVPQVVYLSHLALVSKTFWLHTAEAMRKGWGLPALLQTRDADADAGGGAGAESRAGSRSLTLNEFWPFWMDRKSPATVKNSVHMDKIVLLTGPNMAGKSTVIRSMCAASLLANCGMYAPCDGATSEVPHFDAYILRSAESADSPEEGLSTFAVEMADARAIVRDATRDSLVFVDELCKGTEAKAGACLAAAMLEHLAKESRCLGLFATHLHDMLNLPAVTENTSLLDFMAMETTSQSGGDGSGGQQQQQQEQQEPLLWRRNTTWKIVPGTCTESLAYQVAEQYGVPPSIVQRAYEMDYGAASPPSPAAAAAAAPPDRPEEDAPARRADTSREDAGPLPPQPPPLPAPTAVLQALCQDAVGEGARECHLVHLLPGQVPPPGSSTSSCVYMVFPTGQGTSPACESVYVGETDNLPQRFAQHRQRFGQQIEFAFCMLGANRTLAREVEKQAIAKCLDLGYHLHNINF